MAKGINLIHAMSWAASLASLLTGSALAGEPGSQQYPEVVAVEVTTMVYLEFGACFNQCQPQTTAPATSCSTPLPVTLTLPTQAPHGWEKTIAPTCNECRATVIQYEPNDAEFVTMTTTKGHGPHPTVSTIHPECPVCTGTVIICEPAEPTANAYIGPDGVKTVIFPWAELDGPRVTIAPQHPGEPATVVIGTPGFDKDLSTVTLPGAHSGSPIKTLFPTGPTGEPIPGGTPIVVIGDGDVPGFSDGNGLGPDGGLGAGNKNASPSINQGTGSGGGNGPAGTATPFLSGTTAPSGTSPSDTASPSDTSSPSGTGSPSGTSPSDTASPSNTTFPSGTSPPDTISAAGTASPSDTTAPSGTASPSGTSPSDTASPPDTSSPSGTGSPSGTSPPDTTSAAGTASPSDTTAPSPTSTAPTSCVPTSSPTQSACATALPQACEQIGSLNGLALIPAVPLCVAALGPFAVGNVATCLTTSSISLSTAGSDIINCLTTAFEGQCINTLPQECEDLKTKTGLALVPDLAICAVKLGPFAVGSALTCLASSSITDSSTGVGVVTCLETALGLSSPGSSNEGGDSCTPSTGGQTCVTQLPPNCSNLQNTNGLELIAAVPICLASLGAYGVGNAAQCLATASISVSSVGSDIVNCLLNAFEETCIAELPPACSNLENDDAVQLVVDIPLCVAALGPFAVGGALTCLSNTADGGSSVVSCLRDALF